MQLPCAFGCWQSKAVNKAPRSLSHLLRQVCHVLWRPFSGTSHQRCQQTRQPISAAHCCWPARRAGRPPVCLPSRTPRPHVCLIHRQRLGAPALCYLRAQGLPHSREGADTSSCCHLWDPHTISTYQYRALTSTNNATNTRSY